MKHLNLLKFLAGILLMGLASCGQMTSTEKIESDQSASLKESAEDKKTSLHMEDINSDKRKMMKTADIQMRVENVQSATVELEKLTSQLGGLVMESKMENTISNTKTQAYKADSLQIAKAYQTTTYLKVNIPANFLDSFLNAASNYAQFIENRNIQLEDATLQFLSNEMKLKSTQNETQYQKALQLAKNSKDVISTNKDLQAVEDEKINTTIQNLGIQDKVKYATITVAIHQVEKLDIVYVANLDKQMQVSFGLQIQNALLSGWDLIRQVFIALLYIWPLIILSVVVFVLYKKRKKWMTKLLKTSA